MTHAAEEALKAVLALSNEERYEVIDAIYNYESRGEFSVSDEWMTEIRKRSADQDSGLTRAVLWEEVRDRAAREILGDE